MGGAALKKAAKAAGRNHHERSQLSSRKHLGLLEKKKDYRERARDFNKKKKAVKRLQQKALNKNPDEFYFHMINSRLEGGEEHREAIQSRRDQLSDFLGNLRPGLMLLKRFIKYSFQFDPWANFWQSSYIPND